MSATVVFPIRKLKASALNDIPVARNLKKKLQLCIFAYLFIVAEDTLKKRWKHLKDQFRKELKKKPVSKSGAEAECWVSSWQYFNLMAFMKDEIIPAQTAGNLHINHQLRIDDAEINDAQEESQQSVESQEMRDSEEGPIQSPAPQRLSSSSSSSLPSSTRKRKANSMREDMLELEKKKLMLLEKRVSESRENELLQKDEDYLFLMSILPTMKKLNDLQKLRFRGKINDWLLEAVTQNEYSFLYENRNSYFTEPGTSLGTESVNNLQQL